jgi:peptidyl-prolyl cis-trans isomerase A (cyclophilin A)
MKRIWMSAFLVSTLAFSASALGCDKKEGAEAAAEGDGAAAPAEGEEGAEKAAEGEGDKAAEAKPEEKAAEAKAEEKPAAEKPAAVAAAPAAAPEVAKPAAPEATPVPPGSTHPDLMDPTKATEQAPAHYKVKFETTRGDFVVEVDRSWSPLGADRFYNLVKVGFFEGTAFFRVIKGFMAQIGIHGDPRVAAVWRDARIPDDPMGKQSNARGYLSFATAGPGTRTSQFFVNFSDNSRLDQMGFTPFGKIDDEGMKVIDALYGGYGEGAPRGRGPDQGRMQGEGNEYLAKDFPMLDYVKTAKLVTE